MPTFVLPGRSVNPGTRSMNSQISLHDVGMCLVTLSPKCKPEHSLLLGKCHSGFVFQEAPSEMQSVADTF